MPINNGENIKRENWEYDNVESCRLILLLCSASVPYCEYARAYVHTEVEGTWTKGNGKNVRKLGVALLLTIPTLNEKIILVNGTRLLLMNLHLDLYKIKKIIIHNEGRHIHPPASDRVMQYK